jgi:hypothetical protein
MLILKINEEHVGEYYILKISYYNHQFLISQLFSNIENLAWVNQHYVHWTEANTLRRRHK